MNTVRLEIYTWIGASFGAIHYYAKLHSWNWNDKRSGEIWHAMSKREAAHRNDYLRRNYSEKYYDMNKSKPGDMTNGFDSKQEAIDGAIAEWLVRFPESEMLVDYDDEKVVIARRKSEAQS